MLRRSTARKTLHNRFVRWAFKGVWQAIFEALAAAGGPPPEALLDSTHVKAHRCATGGKGGSRARRSVSAAAFVRTFKRDYVRVSDCADAETVLRSLPDWFTHYNEVHPHHALGYRSPRQFIRANLKP